MRSTLTRREFLRATGMSASVLALVACAPAAPAAEPAAADPTAMPTAALVSARTDCTMDWNPTFPKPFKVYDPPVEVAIIANPSAMNLLEGMTWDNNPMYNRTVENTGYKPVIHWEAPGGDVRTQKLAADLSGGTLPDLFYAEGLFFEELLDNDALEDITEIWETTASPLTKEKKQYPDHAWWRPVMRDGKLFGIPFTWGPAYNVDNLCFIRQDWLDQLGLNAPTTVDEWGAVAKAFQDAGLCEFGISACKNLVTWFQSLDPIFGAYGVMPTCWVPDGNGGLKYDSISPGVKDALGIIRGWYEEGLIDPDFFNYSEGDAYGHFTGSKVGMMTAPWWIGGGLVGAERDNPGMKAALLPYPKGPTGLQGRKRTADVQTQVVFRKGIDPIKVEAAINNLNWHMEMHVNWTQYQQYGEWRNSHAFVEGVEWIWDESCEMKDGPISMPGTYAWMDNYDFGFVWMIYPDYQVEPFREIQAWAKADAASLNKAQRFLLNNPIVQREAELYPAVFDTLGISVANEYYGNATDRMKEKLPDLNTLESETFINIVTGNAELDSFDDFVDEWRANGGDDVTADVSAWFAELKG